MFDDGQQLDMEAAPARFHRTRQRKASVLLLISGGLPTLATFLGFMGLLWWPFEVLANYRAQYALILLGVAVATLLTRRVMWALLICLPLALNIALIVPLYIPTDVQLQVQARTAAAMENEDPEDDFGPNDSDNTMAQIIHYDEKSKILRDGLMWHVSDTPLVIMNLNMNVAERGNEHLMNLINNGQADIILAQSVTESTLKQLSMHGTPYRIHHPQTREDGYGMVMLSRVSLPPKIRILDSNWIELAGEKRSIPSIVATILWFDRKIRILMVHLPGPWSQADDMNYRLHYQGIVKWVNEQDDPVIVMGNFNATPWAAHFSDLLRKTGLLNSEIGFGIQPTWPASGGFPLGEIPVDHCLHSDQLATVERGLGPTNGADHRPLIVKLNWVKPHEKPVSDPMPADMLPQVNEAPEKKKPEKKPEKKLEEKKAVKKPATEKAPAKTEPKPATTDVAK